MVHVLLRGCSAHSVLGACPATDKRERKQGLGCTAELHCCRSAQLRSWAVWPSEGAEGDLETGRDRILSATSRCLVTLSFSAGGGIKLLSQSDVQCLVAPCAAVKKALPPSELVKQQHKVGG